MDSEHIRYGIIGTGMMGVEHIENILSLDNTSVTAIADTDAGSRRTGAAHAGPECAVYENYDDLLADPNVDAVVVVTPNFTHIEVMSKVVASGKHVLCEKPLCTTAQDCDTLIALSEGYDGVIWVGLEYRYMPAVDALITQVRNGFVGDVQMVAIREHRFPFLEKVDDWNRFNKFSGGTLVEKTCHYFDLMNLIIGEHPVQVFASGGQNVNHLDEVYDGATSDIFDNAFVIVDYPNGVRAMLDLCMFAEATKDQEELSVVGNLGKLDARIPTSELHLGKRSGEGLADIGKVETRPITNDEIRHTGLHHGASYLEHVDFVEAVRAHRTARAAAIEAGKSTQDAIVAAGEAVAELGTLVSLDDGRWSVAIGQAAHLSIAENRPVALSEITGV